MVRFVVAAVTEQRDWVAGTVSSLGGWAAQGQGSRSLVYGQGPLSKWQAAALGGVGERERDLSTVSSVRALASLGPTLVVPSGPSYAPKAPLQCHGTGGRGCDMGVWGRSRCSVPRTYLSHALGSEKIG